jgi:uncharacterized protein HemX
MSVRGGLLGAIAVLLAAGLGVGGYLVGEAQAPTDTEADQARQEAELEAEQAAEEKAFERSRQRSLRKGLSQGRATGEREGSKEGKRAGDADASEELAAAEPAAPAVPAGPPLVYTDQPPHGEPGYILPEEQRTLSCVGIDADTGECVGD